MSDRRRLAEVVAQVVETRGRAISVSPSWVATAAMAVLDPERISPPLVYLGCHLELRQIARGQLRGKFESDDDDPHGLFPDLQKRYPTARSAHTDDPEYVLLEHLSKADIAYNVARLRSEAMAKQNHADALESYGLDRAA